MSGGPKVRVALALEPFKSGALPVGFDAQHELIDLPVIADLAAADDAALAAAAAERGQLPGEYRRYRRLRRKHDKAGNSGPKSLPPLLRVQAPPTLAPM